EGDGRHLMESYVHIHPDLQVTQTLDRMDVAAPDGHVIATIEPLGSCNVRLERGWYFPEFGVKHENAVIVFSRSRQTPFGLSYRVRKAARPARSKRDH
ncbi:MAG: heparinase II/III-family protein, partial [Nitrospira sp.]|nr:heparinase II/III-family protein [Nitrospira sp.]